MADVHGVDVSDCEDLAEMGDSGRIDVGVVSPTAANKCAANRDTRELPAGVDLSRFIAAAASLIVRAEGHGAVAVDVRVIWR